MLIRQGRAFGREGVIPETNITGIFPPLGLAYLAAVLAKSGHDVSIIDNQVENYGLEDFSKILLKNDPGVVGFYATTLIWPSIRLLAARVREVLPEAKIIVGGPQLSVYPRETVAFDYIDAGIIGEGEKTIVELVNNYQINKSPEKVKGLVFKKQGKVIINPSRELIGNLDDLPFPAVDLLPYKKYRALSVGYPFFSMITMRGCPYKCSFCLHDYMGNKARMHSAKNVFAQMQLYVENYQAKEIIFFDDVFTLDRERAIELCSLIRQKNLKVRWDIRTRVDLVDRPVLEALKQAGCYRIHMGVESGSQEILDKMNKGITIAQIKESFGLAADLGFQTRGYFMLGFPGETKADFYKTLSLAKELNLDWASFTITMPYPGTDLYAQVLQKGYLNHDYWKEYTNGRVNKNPPYFTSGGMTIKSLTSMKKVAYYGFYTQPKVLFKKLRPRQLYDFLSWIKNKGVNMIARKKIKSILVLAVFLGGVNVFTYSLAQEIMSRAQEYFDNKQYYQAIDEFNREIQANPKNGLAFFQRGISYFHSGNPVSALQDFNQAIQLEPSNPKYYNMRGLFHEIKGNVQLALSDLNKAIELNPKYSEAYGNRGIVYDKQKNFQQALDDFNKAVELDPQSGVVYARRAWIYYEMGRDGSALENFNKALSLTQTDPEIFYRRGIVYKKEGPDELAISDFSKAIELDPKMADAYRYRAELYFKKKDYQASLNDIEAMQLLGAKADERLLNNVKKALGQAP